MVNSSTINVQIAGAQPIALQLSASLTDTSGNPIAGESIDFAYKLITASDYTDGGSAMTDATGTAAGQLVIPAGTYDILVSFAGDTVYQASSVEVTYTTT